MLRIVKRARVTSRVIDRWMTRGGLFSPRADEISKLIIVLWLVCMVVYVVGHVAR